MLKLNVWLIKKQTNTYTAECGGRISDGISTTFDKLNMKNEKVL